MMQATQVSLAVRNWCCLAPSFANTKLAGKCAKFLRLAETQLLDFQENFRGKARSANFYSLHKSVILGWGKVIGLLIGVILSWILAGVGGIKWEGRVFELLVKIQEFVWALPRFCHKEVCHCLHGKDSIGGVRNLDVVLDMRLDVVVVVYLFGTIPFKGVSLRVPLNSIEGPILSLICRGKGLPFAVNIGG